MKDALSSFLECSIYLLEKYEVRRMEAIHRRQIRKSNVVAPKGYQIALDLMYCEKNERFLSDIARHTKTAPGLEEVQFWRGRSPPVIAHCVE